MAAGALQLPLDSSLEFLSHQNFAGCRQACQTVGQLASRPSGERSVLVTFPGNGSLFCVQVSLVGVHELLQGDLPQPNVKRQGTSLRKVRKSTAGHDQRILNDISRVEAALQTTVDPAGNHSRQSLPVAIEQFAHCRCVTRRSVVYQHGWFIVVRH